MKKRIGRYSKYIRPLTILFDVSVLNLMLYVIFDDLLSPFEIFVNSFFWILCSFITSFYEVYRFTKLIQIADKCLKQFAFFLVFIFAYVGFVSKTVSNVELIKYLISCFIIIVAMKYTIFNALKFFRKYYNGNHRRVVIIGNNILANQLADFFSKEKDYGYSLIKHFDNNEFVKDIVVFCSEKNIDEIYLSLEGTRNKELNKFIDFADNSFKTLKYIPTKSEIISSSVNVHYYGVIPILPSRKFALQKTLNKIVKRIFDIIVSLLIIIFVLSWLVPLVGMLIKFETKGPVFFNQKRNGLYYREFNCFKFRSMYVNNHANTLQATKNDKRITKVGKFLRKSSLDEMPQFFNVFIGNMSVCGPRPHMVSLTNQYEKTVQKFKLRHYIKPGITGMAQTHGCRGEIENERDIINRVKYDIFYLENWSLLLDIKIVYLTIKNAILGDKKAY